MTATITTGSGPNSAAVNPVTNEIYIPNCGSACGQSGNGNITVINGATETATTVTDANAVAPYAVAVNPVTNKIYIPNYSSNNVTVLDGATNKTTTVTDSHATHPYSVAVNPITNRIYVVNQGSNNVTVINGATNAVVTTVQDPNATDPLAVAVNPVTNKIYVANFSSNNVTVIDGATNGTTTVKDPNATGPVSLAVNPVTNQVYVANEDSRNVTDIDGSTNNTTTIATPNGSGPQNVAINPVTNSIYIPNFSSSNVTVIDGATDAVSTVTDPNATNPQYAAVNCITNEIYVSNAASNNITVINGSTNATTTVSDSNAVYPDAVAVNPVTNKIYVPNGSSANVTVIDGATDNVTTVTDPNASEPSALNINSVTNKAYVANYNSSNVTVIDGLTNNTATVSAGVNPVAVAVDPLTNKIYVANEGGNNVTVIDGATNDTSTVTDPNAKYPDAIAVNPVTNQIYVANYSSNNVTVINGAGNSTTTVSAGSGPDAIAVNPATNKIYAANASDNNVTVINGFTNGTSTVTDPNASLPESIAVNPLTNKIYVANAGSNNVTVIDGATNKVTTITDANANIPFAIAVNPVTNKIYVANCGSACGGSGNGSVTVIDGSTNAVTDVADPNAVGPYAIVVNSDTNKIFVANVSSSNVTMIDGATNTTGTVTDPNASGAFAIAANPVTNEIYVVNISSGNVSAIAESAVEQIPLTASITAQTNNQVNGASATFSFSAASSFSPTAPPPDALYYQVDTWQGPWQAATSQGSNNFSGAVSNLAPGVHIIYAYATDGQDATSTIANFESSPLISNITAYVFLAVPPTGTPSVVSLSPTSSTSKAQTFTLAYSDTGGSEALKTVVVDFNSTLSAVNGCVVYYVQDYYNQANSALYLLNDSGTAIIGPLPLGSASTIGNSQCTVSGPSSSVSSSGNNLTLHLKVTASSTFEGAKNVYMLAQDSNNSESGWVNKGTWTPSPALVPSVVSVSPGSSTSATQIFTLTYADTGGATYIHQAAVDFNATLSPQNGCEVFYNQDNNTLSLLNNSGNGVVGAITPGSGTLSNSQCTVNGSSTSVSENGNDLILNLSVTAQTSFAGPNNIYMLANDNGGAQTKWIDAGTWTPPSTASVVSASPTTSTSEQQTFTLTYSDTAGAKELRTVAVDFSTEVAVANTCLVYYNQKTNELRLENDAGKGTIGPITPGSGTLQNSQCTINGAHSSASVGTNLILILNVTASGSFHGAKNIYMLAEDNNGSETKWTLEGTWTLP